MHDFKLPRRKDLTLNIDLQQMGLGGDNCWGAKPHPKYTLHPTKFYEYSFVMQASRTG